MKYVLVPQEDIDKIESARKKMFEFLDAMHSTKMNNFHISDFATVSQPMWELTHKKYKIITINE